MEKDYSEIPFEKLIEQNKRLRFIIKLIILALILIIVALFCFKKNIIFTKLKLNGSPIVAINYGEKYIDEGVIATLYNKDVTKFVTVKNNINYDKVGDYEIEYTLKIKYINIYKKIVRKVSVVDKVPPELTVDSDETIYVDENGTYVSPTFKAIDNYDKDITDKVKITSDVEVSKIGEYYEIFSVTDSNNNKSTKKIKVIVQERYKNNYIVVSISNQTLDYYQNNKVVLSSPVVTGYGGNTPYGTYSILKKATNTRLVAADNSYDTRVNYWMAFIGNSHGLHDATWRHSFGGNIYTYDPSHGCVNMPYDKIKELYYMADVGTPVYIVE